MSPSHTHTHTHTHEHGANLFTRAPPGCRLQVPLAGSEAPLLSAV